MEPFRTEKKEKKSLLLYLILAFGLAWLLQAVSMLLAYRANALSQGVLAVSMFAPLLAVLLSRKGLRQSKSGISWKPGLKKNWKWFLAAWLLPPLLTLLGAVLYFVCFRSKFDPGCGYIAAVYGPYLQADGTVQGMPLLTFALFQILSSLTYAPFFNMLFAVGEEAGWRGFLTPVLSARMGRKPGLIVSGLIWAVWHWPLIILSGYEYGRGYAGEPLAGMLAMCLFTTAAGILLSWLYDRSRSIWVPALAHGCINAVAGVPLLFMGTAPAHYLLGPTPAGLLSGIPLFVLAVVLWLRNMHRQA